MDRYADRRNWSDRELLAALAGIDREAFTVFYRRHLSVVLAFLAQQTGEPETAADLTAEVFAVVMLAARRYDSGLDTPFWAYASFWVRKAMQELVAELTRPVALSDRAARDLSRIRRARNEHLQRHGTERTNEELSAATGLGPAQVESLLTTERMPRGLEDRLRADDASSPTIGETIVDPVAEQAYERVLDDLEIHTVLDLTKQLGERERAVIRSHYGLGQEAQTLSEIGAPGESCADAAGRSW